MTDDPIIELEALRAVPPLRDSDYAAIRARVRSGIRREKKSAWFRFAALAALLVVIFGLATLRRPRTEPAVAAAPQPVVVRPVTPPEPVRVVERAPAKRFRRQPSLAVSPARKEELAAPMRIQMATADPDVRIIWILNQAPQNDPVQTEER